jgi:pectinesterase
MKHISLLVILSFCCTGPVLLGQGSSLDSFATVKNAPDVSVLPADSGTGQPYYDILVATDGRGDYKTITEAINALPLFNYERTVIFIKNGVYNEKIRIEQNNLTLLGESRDSTIICFNQLRTDWQNNKDYIGPAVINIHADDIILENLTIKNTQPETGPHAFAVYGTGTRTIIVNCNVLSKGGDTLSLWNYKSGKYYHSNCYFKGSVDFVCPRGWCYIRDSRFYELKKTAAIWHAGIGDSNQKFVICNSYFDGVKGFYLGRHHYDAQFFLLNCSFSENMDDIPIFRVLYEKEPGKNRPNIFGDRYYYYNCHRKGGDFGWFSDNLREAESSPLPEDITAKWTFNGQWDPESKQQPYVKSFTIEDKSLILHFNELISVKGNLTVKTHTGKVLGYETGSGRDVIKFTSGDFLAKHDFGEHLIIVNGFILPVKATVYERALKKEINLEAND